MCVSEREGFSKFCVWISLYPFLVGAHQLNQIQISETAFILKHRSAHHTVFLWLQHRVILKLLKCFVHCALTLHLENFKNKLNCKRKATEC